MKNIKLYMNIKRILIPILILMVIIGMLLNSGSYKDTIDFVIIGTLIILVLGIIIILLFYKNRLYIEVNKNGFDINSIFRKKTYLWKEIDNFYIVTQLGIHSRHKMIMFTFTDNHNNKEFPENKDISIVELANIKSHMLPHYGNMSLEELLKLMRERLNDSKNKTDLSCNYTTLKSTIT